jgi:hypothetical protein
LAEGDRGEAQGNREGSIGEVSRENWVGRKGFKGKLWYVGYDLTENSGR